jgi:hypothetical protein
MGGMVETFSRSIWQCADGGFADRRAGPFAGDTGGGPLWFRKMDHNGDGDISPCEFLDTPEQFKKLDLDGDGLINREVAEQTEALGKEKK